MKFQGLKIVSINSHKIIYSNENYQISIINKINGISVDILNRKTKQIKYLLDESLINNNDLKAIVINAKVYFDIKNKSVNCI